MGWIKIDRKLLDWEWADCSDMMNLWMHILLMANFEDKKWHGMEIGRGSFATSLNTLATQCGTTVGKLRVLLGKLENTGEIHTKSARRYTIISVSNYDKYQCLEDMCPHELHTQIALNCTQIATTKEYNNINNNINNIYSDMEMPFNPEPKAKAKPRSADEVRDYCESKGYNIDPDEFYNYYESNGWVQGKTHKPIKDWKAAVRYWISSRKNEPKPRPSEKSGSKMDIYLEAAERLARGELL